MCLRNEKGGREDRREGRGSGEKGGRKGKREGEGSGKGENGGKRKNDAMLSISPYYYEMHTLYIYHRYVNGCMY